MKEYDLIVIGGGAAGLFCAGAAAERGLSTLVVEKNERLGRKLLITGKGRCNITNDCDPQDFIKAVRSNSRFLYSAINTLKPRDTMEFFENLGVPVKTERGNRVFPVSDKAHDVAEALIRHMKHCGAQVLTAGCREILCQDGAVCGIMTDTGEKIPARAVVLATGGLSYPLTGSTGDGYRMAEALGHTIVPTKPSLVPIVTREQWCSELMGLSLRNVILKVTDTQKKKVLFEELGEMLFTHFGVSGPLVLSASSHMTADLSRYSMSIDLKPALDEAKLDARLLRDFEKYKNRDFINALDELFPRKLIPVMVRLSGIDGSLKVNQITRQQRQDLIALTKALPLTPKAFRPVAEAIVTAGGVSTKEINPKTMESKLVQGLYFAGEVIDLDAYTGGYNLQIAFSTGYLAAQSIP